MLLPLLLATALSPQTAEAVARAAALAAGADRRFDVVSELDLQDAIDFEANKQLCGATSESCASQLAGAYDARLVLFVRLYAVGDESHAALTLTDLKLNTVVQRADAVGADDKALFADVQKQVKEALSLFTDHPAPSDKAGRTRLFISRAAFGGATSTPPPPPAASAEGVPLLPLLGIGGGGVIVGAGVGIAGLAVGLGANGVLVDKTKLTAEKNDAEGARTAGYVVAGVGGAVLVAGAGIAAYGLIGGEW